MSEASSSTTLDPAVIAGVVAAVAVVGFIIFPLLVCYALRKFRAARAEVKRTMKRWPTSDSRDAGRLVWSRNVVPPEAPEGKPPTKGGAS